MSTLRAGGLPAARRVAFSLGDSSGLLPLRFTRQECDCRAWPRVAGGGEVGDGVGGEDEDEAGGDEGDPVAGGDVFCVAELEAALPPP